MNSLFRTTIKVLLIICLLQLFAAPFKTTAQMAGTPDQLDMAGTLVSLKKTVDNFTRTGDRSTGTEGCDQAAAYIRERLAETDPDRLDSVHFTVPVRKHLGSKLIIGEREIPISPILYNAITPESLPEGGLRGNLVYVGKGELADFNGKEIKDAIVLMEFDSGRNWLNAASLGATALIYINRGIAPKNRFSEKEELSPLQFPCFWIEEQTLHQLTGSSAAAPASLNGMTVRLETVIEWVEAKAQNIYALYPGTKEELQNQLIIVEAFYDSSTFIPGHSPGAEESLSIAGLLQLAELLSRQPPSRPFLLVASSG
ncbi:MAG: M28 family metallopeptidase, partial [Desulfobulbaceae bacterium]|nr:M28 family metallopeptidase [Desulfobulbaceae bacterium]